MSEYKNLTLNLSDEEAMEIHATMRDLFLRGDATREERLEKAEEAIRIWRKELWDDDDKAFFMGLGIDPYQFMFHRTYFNSLITTQRQRRFKYDITPRDTKAKERFYKNKEAFVQQALEKGEFKTYSDAADYYDNYADDNYAQAMSSLLHIIRDESDAKSVEDDCFENGVITGADFLKAIYSRKYNRDGSIEISRISQRAMIWDENTVNYNLDDIEFIGEVHELYVTELIQKYPDREEEIRKIYEQRSNKDYITGQNASGYSNRYSFTNNSNLNKIKLGELWTLENEERYLIKDLQLGDERLAEFGLTDDQLFDQLANLLLDEYLETAERTGNYEMLEEIDELNVQIRSEVLERFKLETVREPIWYKTVLTEEFIFEHERSPFLHGCHPYACYFAQFTDGYWTSLLDDTKDIIIALNKAMMFREMMLSSSAKGLLIVDQNTLASSGYTIDDVADEWTQIGGVIALKRKAGVDVSKLITQVTNTGQNLQAINELIRDYQIQLQEITGVNRAQLGNTYAETPAAKMKMELAQGQSANGIIFNNFERTLKLFYKKVLTLVVDMMRDKKGQVLRMVGKENATWLELDINEDFNTFADSMRKGMFGLTLVPVQDDPQLRASNAAKLMELAGVGAIPIEVGLKYSNMEDAEDIVRDIAKHRNKESIKEAAQMVNLQMVQQLASQMGLSPEQTEEFVNKLQTQRYAEMQQQQAQSANAQGLGEVKREAAEPQRQQNIQQAIG